MIGAVTARRSTPLGRLAPVGPEKIESDYAFGQQALGE